MDDKPRIERREEFLVFGLARPCPRAGDPATAEQWREFAPWIGRIAGQQGREAYGVIYPAGDGYDYLCGVAVNAFPSGPANFTALRIPAGAWAVFRFRDHVSTVGAAWQRILATGLPSAALTQIAGPAFELYGSEFDPFTGLGGFEIWVPVNEPA
jgi:AraC family transcriptional regulator